MYKIFSKHDEDLITIRLALVAVLNKFIYSVIGPTYNRTNFLAET